MPKSASRRIAITACRSSRFFDETRTVSPCTCDCTPFGPSDLIRLTIARAFSSSMPWRIVTVRCDVPPPAGCGSPWSSAFRDTLRLMRRSLNTSRTAFTRSSVLALISTPFSPLHAMEAPVFLKSKRCPTSLAAWLMALSTSCRSTLLTTSNDESATCLPPLSCRAQTSRVARVVKGSGLKIRGLTLRWFEPNTRHEFRPSGCRDDGGRRHPERGQVSGAVRVDDDTTALRDPEHRDVTGAQRGADPRRLLPVEVRY